jgi:hypothetical protein
VIRSLVFLLIGIAVGVGYMVYAHPAAAPAAGSAAPARSDVRVLLSDTYLGHVVQQRIGVQGVTVNQARITSVPPNELVARAQVQLGPVLTPVTLQLQPVVQGGGLQFRALGGNINGIPLPAPAAQLMAAGINQSLQRAVGSSMRVTASRVMASGLEIWANYH